MIASTGLMQALAWSLLHFIWQGAAIAALAGALMYVLRTPATRYLVGVGALVLMFASFGVTVALLNPAAGESATAVAATPVVAAASPAAVPYYPAHQPVASVAPSRELAWVAQIWLAGVCLLALRMAFGLLLLEHLRRRNLTALPAAIVDRCRALQQRLGIARVVRYAECTLVAVPAVIGLFRPIVLLPVRALTGLTPDQLEAVVAHELGHIKRLDVAVNFFQVIAETILFFHPAVWWLNKRIRADREDCCDDVAIAACGGKVGYARALATMEGWRDVPTFAMAVTGSSVAARVARLLGLRRHESGSRTAVVFTASLVLAAALFAGAVSVGLAQAAQAGPDEGAFAGTAQSAPVLVAQATPAVKPAAAAKPAPAAKPAARSKPAASSNPASPASPASPSSPANHTSYIDEMKAAGYGDLDVDHLVAMRIQNITPEYVSQMRGAGFTPSADQLIAMKIQDVTPAYVQEMRSLGFQPDADEIIALKVQDVTPGYVKRMRDAGFDASVDDIVALKVHDVTPEYRDALAAAGFKLAPAQVIEAKVFDITPEFINSVHAHGFKDLSFDQLVQLKNADVL